jgi:hypothetical protein
MPTSFLVARVRCTERANTIVYPAVDSNLGLFSNRLSETPTLIMEIDRRIRSPKFRLYPNVETFASRIEQQQFVTCESAEATEQPSDQCSNILQRFG